MTDVEKLASLRVDRTASSRDVKPVDLLRAMAHDIEAGKLVVDGLLLIYMHRPDAAPWEYGLYRSNVTRDQEIVALEMTKERTIREWKQS